MTLYRHDAHEVTLSLFFFNDTATTEIYTLSLHDALPISHAFRPQRLLQRRAAAPLRRPREAAHDRRENAHPAASGQGDRKSTRLNSSHANISYAVFCLKKKKKKTSDITTAYQLYIVCVAN